jgi:hypothetical protein
MAGAFTHLLICDVAKRRKSLSLPLRQLLNRYSQFLFLGAVSPDLPYLSFSLGTTNWADVMHYEKTNGIAVNGHGDLKSRWATHQPSDEILLGWLLGFVSHLVTDATIHPVVQATVGEYISHKEPHRICEMTQDSIIFNEVKNNDVTYAEFSEVLKFCAESSEFPTLMDFWKKQIQAAYPEKEDDSDPSLWFSTYTAAIDVAEGGSGIVAFFRHAGLDGNFLYHNKVELQADYPQYCESYYQKVMLPANGTGTFKKEGFERAVRNVVDAWTYLFNGLTNDAVVAELIRNWNLDTGVDMNSTPPGEVTYWGIYV